MKNQRENVIITADRKWLKDVVHIIPEQERRTMDMDEIKTIFDGKWVFSIHTEDDPFTAVPVIIADKPYEGSEEGIYGQFNDSEQNGYTSYTSLLLTSNILGFEVL